MKRLQGRVALVTGGGEGIGRAICARFAEEGAAVGILDLDGELARVAAAEIAAAHETRTCAAQADVSNSNAVDSAVSTIARELGPPTVLVNNAATFIFKSLDATIEEWRRCLDVNVVGLAIVTQRVVPHMREAGGGSIVNIGSVSGFVAQRGFLTYNASKGAVVEMTRCLALDLVDEGIRVNGVCPGAVWSASVERFAAEMGWSREEASAQPNLGLETMIKRVADPREIAQAVLFLASDEASYITGANLMVDGGWTAL